MLHYILLTHFLILQIQGPYEKGTLPGMITHPWSINSLCMIYYKFFLTEFIIYIINFHEFLNHTDI